MARGAGTPVGDKRGRIETLVLLTCEAAESFPTRKLQTSLQPGTYKEVRRGWLMHIQPTGELAHWDVPA